VSVLARHLNAAPASSVAVTVDIDAVVTAPGDEAPRLIELAQLAKSGEISLEELREASLQVLGVAEAPTVDHSAVTGSEYFELDSDAGQSLLDACTSDRQSESDDRPPHTRIGHRRNVVRTTACAPHPLLLRHGSIHCSDRVSVQWPISSRRSSRSKRPTRHAAL
jgi:hypothetical protein